MKGDKGICIAGIIPNQVRRTKFDTEQHAQDACDFHIGQGFVHDDYIVYNCKKCNMWHFGKLIWAQSFGIKDELSENL